MSEAIAQALLAIGGVGFNAAKPVLFKSGMLSPVYCDNRKFPFWPEEWRKVIRGFEELLRERRIAFDIVGGIEAAGIPHSAALGYAMQMPSIFIRKEAKGHGAKKRVEGGDVAGKRVLLIEDLITTGSSSLAAVEALRSEGAVVEDCLAIISYDFAEAIASFRAAGVRLSTLTTFPAVLEAATKQGSVMPEDADSVRDWLRDPHGWAQRRDASVHA